MLVTNFVTLYETLGRNFVLIRYSLRGFKINIFFNCVELAAEELFNIEIKRGLKHLFCVH